MPQSPFFGCQRQSWKNSHWGGCRGGILFSFLKQLTAGKLQESAPDPELIDQIYCGQKLKETQLDFCDIQPGSTAHILRKSRPEPDLKPEPVDKAAALRELGCCTLPCSAAPPPGMRSLRCSAIRSLWSRSLWPSQASPVTPLLQDKDIFSVFADPNVLDMLVPAHSALVNVIVLVLHWVAGDTLLQGADSSSRSMPSTSYWDMPGGFLSEGLSVDEDNFTQRPDPLPLAAPPAPTQLPWVTVELLDPSPSRRVSQPLPWHWPALQRAALMLNPSTQGHSSGTSLMISGVQSGTLIINDLFSRVLQHALQAFEGSPSFRVMGSFSSSSCTTWALSTMS